MKTHLRNATLAALSLLLAGTASAAAAERPNIILIVADDLGYENLGCYGSKAIKSPVLDRLAGNGLRCTDFHSNGAVCSPTRAALMTGKYQQRVGIDGVVKAATKRHVGVALEEVTMAEALKEQGYATAMFGKWHIGYDPKFNPVHQGFDEFKGFVSGNIDQFSHVDQCGWYDWWHQDQLADEPGYFPRLITDHAVDFIDRNAGKPFFLYLAHAAPHYPIQGPKDKANRRVTQDNFDPESHASMDFVEKYRGDIPEMMAYMDAQIGRVVAKLEAEGLTENTLIVFTSDNGPANNVANLDRRLLKGQKGSLHEGGHRVPTILSWPGTIQPGVCSETMMGADLMPTFLRLAGASKGFDDLDGVDLTPVLQQQADLPERDLFWMQFAKDRFAIRRGPWKLIKFKERYTLYHLGQDLMETRDVGPEHPERLHELKNALDSMIQELETYQQNA